MKHIIYLAVLFIIGITDLDAQNTVGLVDASEGEPSPAYNLFYPLFTNTVYLTDNCGRVVNSWTDSNYTPGSAFELLEDGMLMKTKSLGFLSPSGITFEGGAGDLLTKKDWDDNIIWEYTVNNDTARMHHDFEVLPNGNILIMVWEKVDFVETINLGRNIATTSSTGIKGDFIIEVEPDGVNGGNIVWQWSVLDHIIQDFDNTKPNFGVVADNPQKVNLNYPPNDNSVNWLNSNSIDYNPVLDHILFSVPAFNEIWIIDHSTTTAEAATGAGGNSGKGGDLLFRWGNPETTGASGIAKLGFQHSPQYIDPFATETDEDFNKILLFNNRIGVDYSAVNILTPQWDSASNKYEADVQGFFLPEDFEFEFTADPPQDIYSIILSNAQYLENGNLMVCSGDQSTVWEFNQDNEIVWKYVSPKTSNGVWTQGVPVSNPNVDLNDLFRFLKYPATYSGFDGKDLTPGDYLEADGNDNVCNQLYNSLDDNFSMGINIYPNPASEFVIVENVLPGDHIGIFNLLGVNVLNAYAVSNKVEINLTDLETGLYTLVINEKSVSKMVID